MRVSFLEVLAVHEPALAILSLKIEVIHPS